MNRKRVQRVMRAHNLLQKNTADGRRRRPGYFRVTRADELSHIDMTKVWTYAHGMAIGSRLDPAQPGGTVIHSDQGVQFASWAFTVAPGVPAWSRR